MQRFGRERPLVFRPERPASQGLGQSDWPGRCNCATRPRIAAPTFMAPKAPLTLSRQMMHSVPACSVSTVLPFAGGGATVAVDTRVRAPAPPPSLPQHLCSAQLPRTR